MKPLKRSSKRPGKTAKITISLSHTVRAWALECADRRGFDANFSAYVADLVRRDREAVEDREREMVG